MIKRKVRPLPKLLYGFDDYVSAWVSERMPDSGTFVKGQSRGIGVLSSGGKLIAGVKYFDYYKRHRTMQLAIAAINPIWARFEIIRDLLVYPFIISNVFKAWIVMAEKNKNAIRTTEHIGFQPEALLKHQFGEGKNGILSYMLKPEYLEIYGTTQEAKDGSHIRSG